MPIPDLFHTQLLKLRTLQVEAPLYCIGLLNEHINNNFKPGPKHSQVHSYQLSLQFPLLNYEQKA